MEPRKTNAHSILNSVKGVVNMLSIFIPAGTTAAAIVSLLGRRAPAGALWCTVSRNSGNLAAINIKRN